MLKKTFATLALAALAFFAVPAAAHATYGGQESEGQAAGPVVAGAPVTVVFGDNAFQGAENVSFTVSGFGDVTIAAFKAGTDTVVKQAAADGSVSVVVTPPADARGTYEVTGTGLDSGIVGTATLTVTAADAGNGGGTDADGNALPDTGAEVPVLALWTAGGALALGAALIAVMTIVRRQRLSQD